MKILAGLLVVAVAALFFAWLSASEERAVVVRPTAPREVAPASIAEREREAVPPPLEGVVHSEPDPTSNDPERGQVPPSDAFAWPRDTAPERARLTGSVRTASGAPAPEISVEAGGTWARSQDDGVFEIPVESLQTPLLVTLRHAGITLQHHYTPGGEEPEFVLPELGRVRARAVDDRRFEHVESARLHASLSEQMTTPLDLADLRPDAGGWIEFEVVAGPVTLVAIDVAGSYLPRQGQFEVSPDRTTTAELVVTRGTRVLVELGQGEGEPPEHFALLEANAAVAGYSRSWSGWTGPELRRFDTLFDWLEFGTPTAVPPGRYLVLGIVELSPGTVEIPPFGGVDQTLRLRLDWREP